MGVGDFLFDLFAGLGDQGILICIFLLFLLDALLVPTVPELFFILAIGANTSWEFSLLVLVVGFAGEMVGVFFLYNVVKRTGLPKRVDKALKKYINFLIVSDEKVMLINRIAPMVPFTGAVMAAMRKRWDVRKCLLWLVIGYVFKYGLIMLFGQTATTYFEGGTSRTVMLIAIIAMIVVSAVVAFIRKKKMGIDQQEVEE
ncbi:MAG: hypothetical protein J5920_03640 [Candidatus Methanomethylophilaceae archaeon]|nr:hypothetical protein [Candidatus Methanomethylophilaceae archaeon]